MKKLYPVGGRLVDSGTGIRMLMKQDKLFTEQNLLEDGDRIIFRIDIEIVKAIV